jgi:AraC family transcriptional regulator
MCLAEACELVYNASQMSSPAVAGESAIRLVDRETGRNLPTADASAVVRASSRVRWNSPLVFEVHRMGPHEYEEHVTVGHQLLVNLGGPVRFGWLEEGRRCDATLRTGDLCIQSDGDSNAPLWCDAMTFATASIPPSMVQDALQDCAPAPEATFAKRHCVSDPAAHAMVGSLASELASPTEPLYAEALSLAFVLHLLGAHGQAPGRKQLSPRGKLSPDQLRRVMELIHEGLASNLTLARMALCTGYSPFQFARLFKATTGLAPHGFVLRLRLQRARRLLEKGGASLAGVALATGFYDQAHFTNVFRRAFGRTPGSFVHRGTGSDHR